MTQSTNEATTPGAVDDTPEEVNEELVEVEYSRHGSERLRRFFSFLGISSPLEERSEPDDGE